MLPQENLKFSAPRMPFSCILIAPQAIQTHPRWKSYQDLTKILNKFLNKILVCFLIKNLTRSCKILNKILQDLTRFLQDLVRFLTRFLQDLTRIL